MRVRIRLRRTTTPEISEGMLTRWQLARSLQVLDLGQIHELIHREVHIIAVVVLVEQHCYAVDVNRFVGDRCISI